VRDDDEVVDRLRHGGLEQLQGDLHEGRLEVLDVIEADLVAVLVEMTIQVLRIAVAEVVDFEALRFVVARPAQVRHEVRREVVEGNRHPFGSLLASGVTQAEVVIELRLVDRAPLLIRQVLRDVEGKRAVLDEAGSPPCIAIQLVVGTLTDRVAIISCGSTGTERNPDEGRGDENPLKHRIPPISW
jgi:hypothetical protein